MEEEVGWGDTGKRKQGFRGSPSPAQHQASHGWGLVIGAPLSLGLCLACILSVDPFCPLPSGCFIAIYR